MSVKKNHCFVYIIVFISSIGLSINSIAQDTIKMKKVKALPVPAFGYSPETKTSVGAVSLFNIDLYKDTLTRSSNAKVKFIYTWLKQIIVELGWNYFFEQEEWFTYGNLHYSKYTDSYFGIGSSSDNSGRVIFESNRLILEFQLLKKVRKKWFIGMETRHFNYFNFSTDQDTILYDELKNGSRTGIGWVIQNDNRNNLMTPTKGSFLKFSNNYNFGNTNYSQIIVDGRKYFTCGDNTKQTFATRLYSKHIIGTAPFYDLALIGGNSFVRGYFFGRFRDNNLTTIQAEYRATLFWRIGIAAFGGTSLVYDHFKYINSSSYKPNAGLGLRILVDKEEGTNLRFDYAIGSDGETGFYISFGESF